MSVNSAHPAQLMNNPIGSALSEEAELKRIRAAAIRRAIIVNLLRVLVLAVIIGGWELGVDLKWIDPFFWGQPSGIWRQLVTWVMNGTAQGPLWQQIVTTLEEAVYGFLIGVGLGVVFGVALGTNHFLADVIGPYIKAGNSIPRVALAPIFAIGLGLGMQSKVALSAVLVFFIVFFNAFQGVREVDPSMLANARILGANQRKIALDVILPSAMTWIIASLHTSFSFALVGAVVGEYVGATTGLGLMVQSSGANFNTNGVFAALVILAVVSLTAEALITTLENRLIRWRPSQLIETAAL